MGTRPRKQQNSEEGTGGGDGGFVISVWQGRVWFLESQSFSIHHYFPLALSHNIAIYIHRVKRVCLIQLSHFLHTLGNKCSSRAHRSKKLSPLT